jgi:hypothetical protein
MYQMVERRHVFYRDVCDPNYPDETIAETLQALLRETVKIRPLAIREVDPKGAFLHTIFTPWKGGRVWRITHRQIYMLGDRQSFSPRIWHCTKGKIKATQRPTTRQVAAAVVRACRYPRARLHGDLEREVQLLEALRVTNYRRYSFYRGFRGKK